MYFLKTIGYITNGIKRNYSLIAALSYVTIIQKHPVYQYYSPTHKSHDF